MWWLFSFVISSPQGAQITTHWQCIKFCFQLPIPSLHLLFSSMISFCPDCGKNIQATFKFCPYCGNILPEEGHEGSQTFVKPLTSSFRGKNWALEGWWVCACMHLGREDRCLCSLSDPALIPELTQALSTLSFSVSDQLRGFKVDNSHISVSSLDSSHEIQSHRYISDCLQHLLCVPYAFPHVQSWAPDVTATHPSLP